MTYKKFFNPSVAFKLSKIIKCNVTNSWLTPAIKTVNRIDAWPHIQKHGLKYTNNPNNNLSIVDNYILNEISNDYPGHSGSSMGYVSAHINKIAQFRLDEEAYLNHFRNLNK